jgi:hypothetical protein
MQSAAARSETFARFHVTRSSSPQRSRSVFEGPVRGMRRFAGRTQFSAAPVARGADYPIDVCGSADYGPMTREFHPAMMPPFLRRCPACGHVGPSRRFTAVIDGNRYLVECPSCHHRFEPVDTPWLQ